VPRGQVVQHAEHRSSSRISAVPPLAGMIRRLARNVGQDVPAVLIDAKVAGRVRVARRFKVTKQARGEGTAPVPRAANCVSGSDDLAGVPAAAQWFFAHQSMVPLRCSLPRFISGFACCARFIL
jgi:hypothetical protein